VLRALGLGDFVTGLPALRLLRRALPSHRLVLAAPAVFRPLLQLGVPVDELLATGELQPIAARQPIEVAVDLHGNGPASRRLLHALRPARVVGFGDPANGLPGPAWLASEHEITRWERLIVQSFGLDPAAITGQPARLAVPPEPMPRGLTVLHPGAAAESRRWPAERYAAVADRLIGQGHRVVLTGSAAEEPLLARIGQATGAQPLPRLSLRRLFALVAGARLVICGDTGIAHVASLYRTPSVVLFGPVAPGRWGPPAGGPHRVLWHGDDTGDPHSDEPDPALLRITVPEVLAAIAQLDAHSSPLTDSAEHT
jgi:ADP-heptose:LPS heptosyltransferase